MPRLKQCLSYNISVEGEVCEKLYFEHLARLINECEKATYKVSFFVKKKTPASFYKSRVNTYAKKKKAKNGDGYITYFHVQDLESFQTHNEVFRNLLNEIDTLKNQFGIEYDLGYTNYSFDLWIAIHKKDMRKSVSHRSKYYLDINDAYGTNYQHMDDYKSVEEFTKILEKITLHDVIMAVKRGEAIRLAHENSGDHKEVWKGFVYCRDNPDMTLHQIVKDILIQTGCWNACE